MKKQTLMFLIAFTVFLQVNSQNPTKWRGPEGNGVYPASGLLRQWSDGGPEILWHFDDLGQGYSSPAFANGKIFVSGMVGTTGTIFVLSEEGKLLNAFPYGEEFTESYPGSRSTPTIDGEFLYMLSAIGKLVCMETSTGKIKWAKDIFNDLDGENIRWGVTESLLIDGDKIFCTPGGKNNNVVALNRFSGEVIWSCPGKGDLSAYCSPMLIELPARKILVTMTANNILGIDVKTGKLLWSHSQTNRWSVHANTPIYHNGAVYCFSGYGQGGVKLDLSEDGSSVTKEWFNNSLDSRIGGAVLLDGFIYGSGDNNRQWFCIDWNTGENRYAASDIGKGVVIAADRLIFCYSERGELAMAEANPKEFRILGKTMVTMGSDPHWAHPVIHNEKLYLRHGNTLIAYKIK